MALKLKDFPGYVSEGKEILLRQKHFFVRGSGDINIDKSERLTVLSGVVKIIEPGIDSCLIYTGSGDTETKEALQSNTKIISKRNQLFFNGTISELADLCSTYSDEAIDRIRVSILFKLNRNNVNWEMLFSSLYDPGFLENPKNVVFPAAYNCAKRMISDKYVMMIIYATAYFFPSFLVFGQTENYNLFSDYAVEYCNISEQFENLYSRFLNL